MSSILSRLRHPECIERCPFSACRLAAFARGSNGGLIVTGSALAFVHRNLIIRLAARYKLPAIYYARNLVADGGLMSYGASQRVGLLRRSGTTAIGENTGPTADLAEPT